MFLAAVPILVELGLRAGAAVVPLIAVRTTIAAVCAWTLVIATSWRVPRGWTSDPLLVTAGVVGVGIGPIAGYFAIEKLGPMLYICIYYLHVPAIALLLPRFTNAPPSRAAIASALACMVGVALVVGVAEGKAGGTLDAAGVAFALTAMAFTTMLAIVLHRAGTTVDPARFHAEAMTAGAVILALGLAIGGGWAALETQTLALGAVIAVFAWFPGRLLWAFAVRDAGARTAGIFGALQPMVVALIAIVALGDVLAPSQWAGIVVLTAAVAALQARRSPPARDSA